ncbi:hypothetical protein BH11BAC1_BH11BAC1_22980 [soil metagenome]
MIAMASQKFSCTVLLLFILLFSFLNAQSCSSYKVSVGGKTMVGSNYDTWLTTPRIWFETDGYGSSFTGARPDGANGFAPQTGMNEYGLAFVTLATATPENGKVPPGKKQIASRTVYLKDILHNCKTVDEVKLYVDQYDHSSLSQDVFLYVDRSGKYIVVEPYKIIEGNDPKYVLANFCPSTITDFSTIKQARYVNGSAFVKNKIDTSLAFCNALSDTMHVCRAKHGDGTLLTSILDLENGIAYLYFYHDYKQQVQFILADELAKGNHFIEIPALFPPNKEFKELKNFQTPMNSAVIDRFLIFCVMLFSISFFYFLVNYFRKRKTTKYRWLKLMLAPLSLVMLLYIFMLVREENIFYFPAPYSDGNFSLVSIASYIPFLLLILLIPLFISNKNIFREPTWGTFAKWIFTLNNITYVTLVVLFSYWGFYNIFH